MRIAGILHLSMLTLFVMAMAATQSVAQDPSPTSDQSIEITFWNSIVQSHDPADFEAYIAQFPQGAFARLARNRLNALGGVPSSPGGSPPGGEPQPTAATPPTTEESAPTGTTPESSTTSIPEDSWTKCANGAKDVCLNIANTPGISAGDASNARIFLGVIEYCSGKFDDAVIQFQEAVKLAPNSAAAHDDLGLALTYSSRPVRVTTGKMFAQFDDAIKLNPNDAIAYNNRGTVLGTDGIPDFDAAANLDAALVAAFINRSSAYRYRNVIAPPDDMQRARSDLNTAVQLDPNNSGVLLTRAEFYVGGTIPAKNILELGMADVQTAITADPFNAQAYALRAEIEDDLIVTAEGTQVHHFDALSDSDTVIAKVLQPNEDAREAKLPSRSRWRTVLELPDVGLPLPKSRQAPTYFDVASGEPLPSDDVIADLVLWTQALYSMDSNFNLTPSMSVASLKNYLEKAPHGAFRELAQRWIKKPEDAGLADSK